MQGPPLTRDKGLFQRREVRVSLKFDQYMVLGSLEQFGVVEFCNTLKLDVRQIEMFFPWNIE